MYLLSRHLIIVLPLCLLLLTLAACDAGVDATEELAAPSGPLAALSSPATLAPDDSLSPWPLLEQLEREARRAGLQIDPSGYTQQAKGGQIVAGVPIVPPKPPGKAQLRRGVKMFVVALVDPLQPQQARLFYVHGRKKGRARPKLEVYDTAGRRDRSTTVATAVASLLPSCLRPGTAEGTFETVCEGLGGTVEEHCEDCWLVFTCCERFCVPS